MLMGQLQGRAEELFGASDTFATSLTALCIESMGTEFLSWDPETLAMEIGDQFGEDIPKVNYDKVMAMVTALTTDQVYTDPIVFTQMVLAFNDRPVNWVRLEDDLATEEIAWAVMELALNDHADGDVNVPEWEADVAALIGYHMAADGFARPASPLKFAILPSRGSVPMDSEMAAAVDQRQSARHEEVADYLRKRLAVLNQQLAALPIALHAGPTPTTDRNYVGELLQQAGEPQEARSPLG